MIEDIKEMIEDLEEDTEATKEDTEASYHYGYVQGRADAFDEVIAVFFPCNVCVSRTKCSTELLESCLCGDNHLFSYREIKSRVEQLKNQNSQRCAMNNACGDNRFELIGKYKNKLIEATNISDDAEEMAVIDNILFRFWQMGWLDTLEQNSY